MALTWGNPRAVPAEYHAPGVKNFDDEADRRASPTAAQGTSKNPFVFNDNEESPPPRTARKAPPPAPTIPRIPRTPRIARPRNPLAPTWLANPPSR